MNQGKIPRGREVDVIIGASGEYCGWTEVNAFIPSAHLPMAHIRTTITLPTLPWKIHEHPRDILWLSERSLAADDFWNFVIKCPFKCIVKIAFDGGHPLWLPGIGEALCHRTGKSIPKGTSPYWDLDSRLQRTIEYAFDHELRSLMDEYNIRLDLDEVLQAIATGDD